MDKKKKEKSLVEIFQDRIRAAIAHLFWGRHESVRKRIQEGKVRFHPHSPMELRKELEEFLKKDSYRCIKDPESGIIILNEDGTPKRERCLGRPISD